jgi:Immunity protein 10
MRLEFKAVEGGFDGEDGPHYCLMCGVSGRDAVGLEHYLNFQRGFDHEDPSEDWGVHFEFDDQINGAYNCVGRCRLTRAALEVDLSQPIDWQKKYTGVSADISELDDATVAEIRAGLPRIFRGTDKILQLA